jgi:hypothetical protein
LRRPPRAAHFTGERWLGTEERPQTPMDAGPTGPRDEEGTGIMRQILIQNPRAAKREKQSRKPRKKVKNIAHSGTATTAQNGEWAGGGESLWALCSLCRCEKNKKLAHSGTATTAQNEEWAGDGKSFRALCSLCRCEKNKKLAHGGTATTARNQTAAGGGARWRKHKSSGAVFVVSL